MSVAAFQIDAFQVNGFQLGSTPFNAFQFNAFQFDAFQIAPVTHNESISLGATVRFLLAGEFEVDDWIKLLPITELVDFAANQQGVTPEDAREATLYAVELAQNSVPVPSSWYTRRSFISALIFAIRLRAAEDPVFRVAVQEAGGGSLL